MNEELRIKITAQVEAAQKNLKDIAKTLEDVGEQGKKSASKFGDAFKKMGDATAKALKVTAKAMAAASAAALAGVVALTKNAIENYAEYEQLVGGVDTLFKDSSQKVQQYANEAYKSAGMGANEYMATITSFSASLLQSLEGDTAAAAEAGNQAVIDMADNANKMGTSMEMIQNAYQGFAKQNYTMLDNLKLGYGGTKTEMERLLADAQKISGVKYDINNLADVYNAIHVIQTELGITGTTAKEAASTIQGSAAMMKASWTNLVTGMANENADFDALLNNFIESVGAFASNLIPRIEVALGGIVNLIEGLAPKILEALPKLVSTLIPRALEAVKSIINSVITVLPSLLDTVLDLISNELLPAVFDLIPLLTGAIISALPQLIDCIFTLIGALCAELPDMLFTIIEQVLLTLPLLVESLISNLPILINGIILLITEICTQLPSIILMIADMLPSLIDTIIVGLIACLPQLLAGLLDLTIAVVAALPGILVSLVKAVINTFVGLWNSIQDIFANCGQWFKDAFSGAWQGITEAFASCGQFFTDVWDSICEILAPVGEWFSKMFSKAWDGITKAFANVKKFFSDIWNSITSVFNKVGSWFKDQFTTAFNNIKNAFSSIGSFFSGIWENIKSIFSKVGTAIADGIKGAVSTAVNKVLSTACKIINGFISAINFAIDVINAIPGVSISRLSKLSVPAMAQGGVVDSATLALIGERGKEMVMPLENNLKYLDKLAGMITERMGGGCNTPIVLSVDGKVFAETAINTLNRRTEQTGKLDLILV